MTGSKPVALPLGYAPSLYCAGRVVLHSRRGCGARRLPVVDRELERRDCRASDRCAAARALPSPVARNRRELVGGIGDAPESLLERRERAVGARARVPARKSRSGKPSSQCGKLATGSHQPSSAESSVSGSVSVRVSPRAVTVSASGRPATCSTPLRSGPRTASSSASSCWRQLKLPWNAAVARVDGEPAAHLPRADGVERARAVGRGRARRCRRATTRRRTARPRPAVPAPRASSWREPLVDLLQVVAVGVRRE